MSFVRECRRPKGYWDSKSNCKNFMDWLATHLGFKYKNDWFSITQRQFIENGGKGLLDRYSNSPLKVVRDIYPELEWNIEDSYRKVWTQDSAKDFLDRLAQHLGFKEMEDWYRIRCKEFIHFGGNTLLRRYHYSPYTLLSEIYPKHNWKLWRFSKLNKEEFWERLENQKEFLDWLSNKLELEDERQIKISTKDLIFHGGEGIVRKYGNIRNILHSIYPEKNWESVIAKRPLPGLKNAVKKPRVEQSVEEQRRFFDGIFEKIGLNNMEDWYKVTHQNFIDNGGRLIFSRYGNSPNRLLRSIYPQHEWLPWKFQQTPKGFWDSLENIRLFMDWLYKILNLKNLEDWYRVSVKHIRRLAPNTAFERYGKANLLVRMYPKHSWDMGKLEGRLGSSKASQGVLARTAQDLFPDTEVVEDYLHPDLKFASGHTMELDVYLPKYHLAFEYQGQQHYFDSYNMGPQWVHQERDEEKRVACNRAGITLIEVPYWWDFTKESLISTIEEHREGLIKISRRGPSIPVHPPS